MKKSDKLLYQVPAVKVVDMKMDGCILQSSGDEEVFTGSRANYASQEW